MPSALRRLERRSDLESTRHLTSSHVAKIAYRYTVDMTSTLLNSTLHIPPVRPPVAHVYPPMPHTVSAMHHSHRFYHAGQSADVAIASLSNLTPQGTDSRCPWGKIARLERSVRRLLMVAPFPFLAFNIFSWVCSPLFL